MSPNGQQDAKNGAGRGTNTATTGTKATAGGGGDKGQKPKPLELDSEMEQEEDMTKSQKAAKLKEQRTLFDVAVYGTATASLVMQILAMAFWGNVIVYIAGAIAIVIAPVVILCQKILQDGDSLRRVQNQLRKEVNRLSLENDKLTQNIDELEPQVEKLKRCQTEMEIIAQQQGSNVDSLVSLVNENQKLLDAMDKNVRASTAQILLKTVLLCDTDNSFHISDSETGLLILRIKNVEAVELDEDRLRQEIKQSGGDLGSVLDILKSMADDRVPEEKKVIRVNIRKLRK